MLIVSLTTIPPRFEHLYITINSILSQTVLPDKIIIHIPKVYNNYPNNYILPNYADSRVIINNDTEDYGPGTKLLGLYRYKVFNDMCDDDTIIVIDDDRIYNKNMIKTMLEFQQSHPDKVLTVAGWDIETITGGKYKITNKKQPRGVEYKKDGYIDFLGGCCGFLINKRNCPFSHKEIFSLDKNDPKYYVDDIWISGFLTLSNTSIYLIPNAINKDELRQINNSICALADGTRLNKNIACIDFFRNNYDLWKDNK